MSHVDQPEELQRLLDELPDLRLRPDDWAEIATLLDALVEGRSSDVTALSSVVFEARIRRRFRGGRASGDVAPTKQTSVLPWVGLACGALLFGVGALLGGGIILVGVALLGLFVFGVAYAGSLVAHRTPTTESDPGPDPVPMPAEVATAVGQLRAS